MTTAPAVDHAAALARFTLMRLNAAKIMEDAAKMAGLPDHLRAQAQAAANLLQLRLHQIYLVPGPADANEVRKDLETIAARVVDPLVEAIGEHAKENLPNIKIELFQKLLFGALDGEGLFNLDESADRIREERREIEADPRGWSKAQAEGVD